MPEAPEVEALAADLRRRVIGLRIARIDISTINALKTVTPALTALNGEAISDAYRRGKFLVVQTTGPRLVIHLARAGWLHLREEVSASAPRVGKGPLAVRIALMTDEGEAAGALDLTEAGTKKGLALYVVEDERVVPGIERLGPDALSPEFTPEVLADICAHEGRRQIKGLLRDQSAIAGIGNAYSDEILHVAGMSPFTAVSSLSKEQVNDLHRAITTTLSDAVARSITQGAASLKAEKKAGTRVHGRAGQMCPECGDVVREVSFADSALQYCATCQTGGKPLADRRLSKLLK